MQPEEIKEKPKVEKKIPTPVEQWDILAAQVIAKELAPKGFKKLTSGSYRGIEIANHSTPGITKSTVRKCQNIGASLVRGYRERLKREIENMIAGHEHEKMKSQISLEKCAFWRFKERSSIKRTIAGQTEIIGAAKKILFKLNEVPIQ